MLTVDVIIKESVPETDKVFCYGVKPELEAEVKVGQAVIVPFGIHNTARAAYIVSVNDGSNTKYKLKYVKEIIDKVPVLKEDQIKLISFISKKYNCTMSDAIALMVPTAVINHKNPKVRVVCLKDEDKAKSLLAENKIRSSAQINMLTLLFEKKEIYSKELLTCTGSNNSQLSALREKGLVEVVLREEESEVKESETADYKDSFKRIHKLNDEQENAVSEIISPSEKARVFLLNGITGSGKTECYLHCASEYISRGSSVLYLVPEISLTPQTVSWLEARFEKNIAVMHSRLTDKQRYEEWNKIRMGKAKIIVAARSGIFAPIDNLKLIIIDEEHDSSYKSETHPKYNAKEIAIMRAKINGATVLLGSATPSVETYYAASLGVYKLLSLTKRANPNAKLPKVNLVDMKEQFKLGSGQFLSIPLKNSMSKAVADNKQTILFLNRRGYTRTLVCMDCGETKNCPSCSVGMTLHTNRYSKEKLLICHYCGYTLPVSECVCDSCGGKKFENIGFGTEQLEEYIKTTFPSIRVLRMDQDTTLATGSHADILEKFREHEADVLIGTQMIAKGHDFPDVTVVGILDTDIMTAASDIRATERAFQLITQASGRAGRDEAPGEVYIQTFKPKDELIKYASTQNYKAFFDAQIEYRKALNLPPFKALGEIMISAVDEEELAQKTSDLNEYLKEYLSFQDDSYGFELYGPVSAPVYELRGRYRNVFNLKAKNKSALTAVFKQVMSDFDYNLYHISFDADK